MTGIRRRRRRRRLPHLLPSNASQILSFLSGRAYERWILLLLRSEA